MTVVLLVFAVAVLDFSPMLSLFDQAPLAEFVSSVGLELLKQYVDRTVQSGVYSPAASDASVQNALTVLRMASNLTGSPKYAGRASISLGDVQSRHLGEWKAALVSYRRAEELLPYSVIPKYQISRCYVELGLYETVCLIFFPPEFYEIYPKVTFVSPPSFAINLFISSVVARKYFILSFGWLVSCLHQQLKFLFTYSKNLIPIPSLPRLQTNSAR